MKSDSTPEFSKAFNVETLGEKPKILRFEADAEERDALAARFDILSVESIAVELRVVRIGGGGLLRVRGFFTASIKQACVVTDVPVEARIEEEVDERFGPPVAVLEEVEFSLDDVDPPEPIVDETIDLGELVAQYIGVAIEPYPKAVGAEIPVQYQEDSDDAPETVKNPFGALAELKKAER
jgi:uncharacterized metal-binding protein YceD (DUF177 family)